MEGMSQPVIAPEPLPTPCPKRTIGPPPTPDANGLVHVDPSTEPPAIEACPAVLGQSTQVSDPYGEYTVDSLVAPPLFTIVRIGVTKEKALSVLEFFTEFVGTQTMDSMVLDNYSRWKEWKTTVAPRYIAASYLDEILNVNAEGTMGDVVFTNVTGRFSGAGPGVFQGLEPLIPLGLRDGGTRVVNKTLRDVKIEKTDLGIYVSAAASEIIFSNDEADKKFWALHFADDQSSTEFFNSQPYLNDGIFQARKYEFSIGYFLVPDGSSWKICGVSNGYVPAFTIDSNSSAPAEILALRK
jgi:hypothetical protein